MVSPDSCEGESVDGLAVTATHKPNHPAPWLPVPCAPLLQSWIRSPASPADCCATLCPRSAQTSASPHLLSLLHQPWAVSGPDSYTLCSSCSPSPTFIGENLGQCLGYRTGLGLGVGWLFTAHWLLWSEADSFETHLDDSACHPG